MSGFLTELRGEVLDAHAARRRRGRARALGRTMRSAAPRASAPAAVIALLAVALLLIRPANAPPPAAPRVVEVVRIGGNPTGAVSAGGSIWIGDFAGRRVVELAPATRRVVGRFPVRGQPVAVAAGPGGVWFRAAIGDGGAVGRVGSRDVTPVGHGPALAVSGATTWAADVELPPEGLRRIDARTGRDAGRVDVPGVYALAAAGESLWAVTNNGTALRLDPRSGAIRARWPAIALSAGTAYPALAADGDGAWVLRVGRGADNQAIRLEGDRVARRIPIEASVRPLLAPAPDGLWTVAEDTRRRRYTALRLDPRVGRVRARVDLGARLPVALVPVGDEVWSVAGDGTVSIVGDS